MSSPISTDDIAAAYEARVAAVPEAARRFAAETWGETWAHAEMGSLLDFAALLAAGHEVATPSPDPRKEALTVLKEMRFTPEECIEHLRRQAGSSFAAHDVRRLLHARADAIETALSTLSTAPHKGAV